MPLPDAAADAARDPSAPPALETVLDLPYLHTLTGQPQQLRGVVQAFVASSEPVPRRLAQALAARDDRQARDLLHELYGAAETVGARALRATCQQLLDRAPGEAGRGPASDAETIAAALHQTRAALARVVEGLPSAPEPASRRPAAAPTLLILDDSPTLRERLRQLLADDYRLVEADSGRAALAACAGDNPPDLLLVDLNLGAAPGQDPEGSGLDVIRQLHGAIPCVVLTVDRSPATRRTALQAGAWAYLLKPPEPEILRAALEAALARARDVARAASQPVIDLATGILMATHHLSEDDARRLLKTLASAERRTVRDVAEHVVGAQRFQSRLAQLAGRKPPTPSSEGG